MQIPFSNWPNPNQDFTLAEYEYLATHLVAGGYDAVIIRSMNPQMKQITALFHGLGLRVYRYEFWGAVRRSICPINDANEVPRKDAEGKLIEDKLCLLTNHTGVPTKDPIIPDGLPAIPRSWVLTTHTHSGHRTYYTANNASGHLLNNGKEQKAGGWLLLDTRIPEVRDYIAKRIAAHLEEGFDGIFLDGAYHWATAKGYVGGDALSKVSPYRRDKYSYSYSKCLLLKRIKEMLPGSHRLGALVGSHYFDHLHQADFLVREFSFGLWHHNSLQPYRKSTVLSLSLGKDWKTFERSLIKTNLAVGTKVPNPLFATSATYWMDGKMPTSSYVDLGTISRKVAYYKQFGPVLADMRGYAGSFVKGIKPAATKITTVGVSRFTVDRKVKLTFNTTIPLFDLTGEELLGDRGSHDLLPGRTYVAAERTSPGWRWSKEHFAYSPDSGAYLWGDFRFNVAPVQQGSTLVLDGYPLEEGQLKLALSGTPTRVIINGVDQTAHYNDLGGGVGSITLPPGRAQIHLHFD